MGDQAFAKMDDYRALEDVHRLTVAKTYAGAQYDEVGDHSLEDDQALIVEGSNRAFKDDGEDRGQSVTRHHSLNIVQSRSNARVFSYIICF